jgi:hypothetical protein
MGIGDARVGGVNTYPELSAGPDAVLKLPQIGNLKQRFNQIWGKDTVQAKY